MVKTNHIQLFRGTSRSITRIARDERGRAIDLTDAEIFLSVRADMKIAPTFNLTSREPAPEGWRTGIVINNQNESLGSYTYSFITEDTIDLVALGHDDPWLYDVTIRLADGTVIKDISTSNLDLYPQIGDALPVEEP